MGKFHSAPSLASSFKYAKGALPMPQRQSTKRIVSTEVQGDDSYIELIAPKMDEMKQYREAMLPIQQRIEQMQAEDVSESDPRMVAAKEELNTRGAVLVSRYVKAWNWVDDDGNPLPPPSAPESYGMLNLREINWLTKQFEFSDAKKKK
jgi:hypothetical protein